MKVVERPWGEYVVLETRFPNPAQPMYQVKRLCINPGEQISLQSHKYRSEHWVVVAGVATVERGKEKYTIFLNETVFIPAGIKHRLSNQENDPLIVIEVQLGKEIREDDIIRYEDKYGRI